MVHRQTLFSYLIIICLTLLFILSAGLFFASVAKKARITDKIASDYEIIKSFAEHSDVPLSEESIALLTDERDKLKRTYSRFKLAFISPLNEELSPEDLDPLQFKERLIQTQKRLREDAGSRNLLLPDSLGFAKYETELSELSKIPSLISRLKVLQALINLMAFCEIEALSEINFPEKTGKEGDAGLYFEIPVTLAINCTSSELLNFLYELMTSPFMFIVEDLDIVGIAGAGGEAEEAVESNLKADVSLKVVVLN